MKTNQSGQLHKPNFKKLFISGSAVVVALALSGCVVSIGGGSKTETKRSTPPPAALTPPLQPATAAPASTEPKVNTAIVPVSRTGAATNRQATVLKRAKDNPGPCDIVFIGDSITQGWEGNGKNVWAKYYGSRKCLNFGVGGDRTQHVLWRFEQGQLEGLQPKAAVLMIGTNNSNKDDNSEADILEGCQAIVKDFRTRLPETKLLICAIFPRGKTFSTQRGKILQVNQALARMEDGDMIRYVDFGSQLVEDDGSISKRIMPDYLHLTEQGYEIWAQAIEPQLKAMLGEN